MATGYAPWGLPSERFCGIVAEVIVLGGLWMTPVAAHAHTN